MALYPNAFTHINSKRIKIQNTVPLDNEVKDLISKEYWELIPNRLDKKYEHGTIINIIDYIGFIVSTSTSPILILSGQVQGKKRVNADVLVKQLNISIGDRFIIEVI